MPESMNNLIGGALTGFVGSKNKAREMALNEEYKKIAMENVKATAKLHEAQIKKADLEGNLLQWAMGGDSLGGAATSPAPAVASQPPTPQPLPELMAQQQTSGAFNSGGKIPSISGAGGFLQATPAFSQLHPSLSEQATAMAKDYYQLTGEPLKVTDAFRSYAQQADVHRRKPSLALPPGTSQHEKGLAIDIDPGQAQKLMQTGLLDKYGFTQPAINKGETYHLELGQVPQAQTQQIPQVTQYQQPSRGGLTREKFLEGYMKKNFGVEPDEIKETKYGDHVLILDKKKGTPLFIIAGQGKTEMVDTTLPDGSIIKRPIVIPPSPLPNGIPVFNSAGGGQGGLMAGPGMQVGPPKMIYEEVTAPGGAKVKRAVPQAQAGVPDIQTEPGGVKMADLGYANLMMQGASKLNETNKMMFPDGKLDRALLFKANLPGGGLGEGATLYSKMYQTVEAALRLETKAAATPGEVETKLQEFWPNTRDTEKVVREKMRDLNEYFTRVQKLYDPTGEMGKAGGVSKIELKVPKGGLRQKPKTWEELKKGLVGGQ